MGERVIDRDFIEKLGKDIQKEADGTLPQAKSMAVEAQEQMKQAGQGGGFPVVMAFFFGSEYAEQAWDTKQEEAGELNSALQRIAQKWQEIEDTASGQQGGYTP
ncbi:hypothetical protein [Flindersiella endophytica]